MPPQLSASVANRRVVRHQLQRVPFPSTAQSLEVNDAGVRIANKRLLFFLACSATRVKLNNHHLVSATRCATRCRRVVDADAN